MSVLKSFKHESNEILKMMKEYDSLVALKLSKDRLTEIGDRIFSLLSLMNTIES